MLLFVLIKHRVQQRHSAVIIRSQQGYTRKCSSKCAPYKLGPGEIKGFELMAGGQGEVIFHRDARCLIRDNFNFQQIKRGRCEKRWFVDWGHYGRTDAGKRLTSLKGWCRNVRIRIIDGGSGGGIEWGLLVLLVW